MVLICTTQSGIFKHFNDFDHITEPGNIFNIPTYTVILSFEFCIKELFVMGSIPFKEMLRTIYFVEVNKC
jgi:hypothetical protein